MTRSPTFSPAADTTTPPHTSGPRAPRLSPPGKTSPASPWRHNHAYRRASLSPLRFPSMRRCQVDGAIEFIIQKFSGLVVFGKELVLLMEALENEFGWCFEALCEEVVQAILSPPASSVQVIRTWLLEIFVRNIISPSADVQQKLEGLGAVIDKRQLLLIRGRRKDVNFFRKQKTAVQSFSDVE